MFLFFFYFLGTIFLPWEFQLNFFNSNLWKICRNWNFYERKNSEIFREHFKFHQMSKTFFLIFYSKFNFNFKTKKPLLRTKIKNLFCAQRSAIRSQRSAIRRWAVGMGSYGGGLLLGLLFASISYPSLLSLLKLKKWILVKII